MADKHTNCHLKTKKNSEIIEFVINSTEADSFSSEFYSLQLYSEILHTWHMHLQIANLNTKSIFNSEILKFDINFIKMYF